MAGMTMEFNTETAIAEFLADSAQCSLELPRMTTGQRKHAKKVVDQHPELTCVSYGFGQDRQLHVFKQSKETDAAVTKGAGKATTVNDQAAAASGRAALTSSKDESVRAVSVKNTFIDDWVAQEAGDDVGEPIAFRSMPPRLDKSLMHSCILEDVACDANSSSGGQQSTAPSSCSSPRSSAREQVLLSLNMSPPPGLEVRNTFLHFDEAPADQRVVQSMPHDMFRQCLLAEVLSDLSGRSASGGVVEAPAKVASPVPTPVVAPAAPLAPVLTKAPVSGFALAPGTDVVIDGLLKCPAFNGLTGRVQSLDEASGRYNILLSTPAAAGHKFAKLKAENLLVVLPPPPPCVAPALSLEQCESPTYGIGQPMMLPRNAVAAPAQPLMLSALV